MPDGEVIGGVVATGARLICTGEELGTCVLLAELNGIGSEDRTCMPP